MKLKQIKRRDDLPKSFSLDKYKPASMFNIRDWVVNLEARALFILVEDFKVGVLTRKWGDRAERTLESPIFDGELFDFSPGLVKNINISNVCDFKVLDFYLQGKEFSENDSYKEYLDIAKTAEENNKLDLISMAQTPFYKMLADCDPLHKMLADCGVSSYGDVIAKINMHGSDEKIKNDFANWLASTRRELDIHTSKREFSVDDFSSWSANAILPYLDLTFWARANGCEITQQILGVSLFPNEYNVNLAERIRKVVAPAARSMARVIFTNTLRSQATAEYAEPNLPNDLPVQRAGITLPLLVLAKIFPEQLG